MAFYKNLGLNTKKLFGLGWRDIALLAEAWLLLTWVDLVISLLPYRYWSRWLQGPPQVEQDFRDGRSEQGAARIIRLSEAAARNHPRAMNCLRRCFSQQHLLRRRHMSSQIHIGVRKTVAGLEAHAWLSSQGRVLNDTPDVGHRYAELQAGQWASISRFVS
ncbi:MAG: lasso peptide biosynthesis B2 protein [Porticoccaceae bacterium]|nr:lasso peptide biosynthesis B2 protein [Porticoccaceae bacterium]